MDWVNDALAGTPVARLATVSPDGRVGLVPICFVVVDGWLASAVDHKPKRTGQLRRLDDIDAQGRATVLVDHYDDDWTQLWWVRVEGPAEVRRDHDEVTAAVTAALAGKYAPYRETPPAGPVYRVALETLRWWRAADGV